MRQLCPLALFALLLAAAPLQAAEPDPEAVQALIKQLGDEDGMKREEASRKLGEWGGAVAPALKKALETAADAEVKARLEGLVARLAQVVVTLETTQGAIRLRLFTQQAPLTCASFANLVRRGFYDGLTFHRVLPNFMIQGGDPQGNGMGGPGYAFEDEFDPELRHDRPGILSMANAGPRTNGSQFFVTHVATPHLNDKHSVFGVVLSREDQAVVNKIQRGDKIVKASLEGDVSALFGKMKERLAEWNKVLDQRFKNLKPAE